MSLTRISVNCITVLACMLVLASTSQGLAQETSMLAKAYGGKQAIEAYNCSICQEPIDPNSLSELVLWLGSNTKHAFHRKCMAEWIAQKRAGKSEETHPGCADNWKVVYKRSRREVSKEFILQSIKEEKELEELKGRLSTRESKQAGLGTVECLKILGEVYIQFSYIYKNFSRDFTSSKDLGIDAIFVRIGEETIGRLPIKEAAQALLNAPKFFYGNNVVEVFRSPSFYTQLNRRQSSALGKYLLTLAAEDCRGKSLFTCVAEEYTFYNLDAFNNNEFECLIDLTESLKLENVKYRLVQALENSNIDLSLKYRVKLARLLLQTLNWSTKLCMLQNLGYFTEFTEEMRQGVINCYAPEEESRSKKLILNILSFRSTKAEGESRTEIPKLLKEISGKFLEIQKREMLELKYYHHMMRCPPNDSLLCKCYRLIMHLSYGYAFPELIPFIPLTDFKTRRNLVLTVVMLKRGSIIDSKLTNAIYLHSNITFKIAMRSFFNLIVLLEENGAHAAQLIVEFKVFFKRDLEDEVNARIFFRKLERNRLYALVPLFREYFSKTPSYEECVAKNMEEIIRMASRIHEFRPRIKILYALCNTDSDKIEEELCNQFPEFLKVFLQLHQTLFCSSYFLKNIFGKGAFARRLTAERIKEIIFVLIKHKDTAESFENYTEMFFINTESMEARTRMLAAMSKSTSSIEIDRDIRNRVSSLLTRMEALAIPPHISKEKKN